MQKPEVRFIETQQETKNTEVDLSSLEAQQILLKYKIDILNAPIPQSQNNIVNDPNRELTFEELTAIEENKIRAVKQKIEMERQREMNKPQSYSIDRNNINYYDTQFKSIEDSGFGIQVQVVSDMPIKGYGY